MAKNVLFIHGAGEGAYEEDVMLAQSLQHELGSAYTVHFPRMVNEDSPEYSDWQSQITEVIASLSEPIYLAGHSIGGSVVLKYTLDHKEKHLIAGLFLIATPFWGADEFWKWDEVSLPNDANDRLEGIPVFLYHNKKDQIVPFNHLSLYAENLPDAIIREVDKEGHQLSNDLSDVALDIRLL